IIFFYLLPIRKKVAFDNLDLCFPEKDILWKKNIVKQNYINLGINLTEFLYLPKLNKKLLNSFIRFENQVLVAEGKRKNNGIFILSGHYSNWELMAYAYAKVYDDPLSIIAKVQASRGLNNKINEYRKLAGNDIIEIGFSLKNIFKKLMNNEAICFLIDQSAHPDYSVYIDFFGMKVPAFSGPAKIALRNRPELLIAYGVRSIDYSYTINFENVKYDDIQIENEDSVRLLTQRIQTMFEQVIRRYPGQWLWLHKRFKHRKK
ncbi:MAG: hypothetical protein ABI528_03780, partial [bacterium]